ncbi:MAG TPA: YggS family pyridoxal phosphate-dependent enzyme [Dyella sp.]|uniref:YggS family pyridoxal phosphate-dependent enzyme n=1 Tax=Dyella sp. TaxID=1869338 RepID=UPI002BB15B39|nr:YggS family pyridoxal phosphate-dependent enzyme [Dyella sp.]HUB88585.1 YggS family pyridoxal phosphate-dependent enzyme [Dyella sp.]
MTDIAANWAAVRQRVDAACREAGRDPTEVTVLPVSKTFGPEAIRAALALGLHRFGENKVQEIREKAAVLASETIDWVVIGHLQTNKAKDVARLASEVQSLDRLELAEALQHRLEAENRSLDVLVQVKTAREDTKHGLPAEALPDFLQRLRAYSRLRVNGLMTLATLSEDTGEVRACFRQLRELRDRCAAQGHALPRLSMGMSGDFPLAIAEGASEVRIGTAIFGSRLYAPA